MTRYLLCAALVSMSAEAQIAPCGNATCVGNDPGDVKLGGTLLETRGARPDGGVAALRPVVPGASLVLQSIQPTGTSVLPDVIIGSTNAHDGGTILSVRNGTSEVFAITPAGAVNSSDRATLGIFGYVDAGVVNASRVEFAKSNPFAPTLYDLALAPGYLHLDGGFDVSGPFNLRASNVVSCGTAGNEKLGVDCSTGALTTTGAVTFSSTTVRGTITLGGGGTGTATVTSGAVCVCSEATDATKTVKCAVSSTTLTATGTAGDDINYICL